MGTLYGIFRSLLEKILGLFGLGLVRKPDLLKLKAMDAAHESNLVDFEIIQKLSGPARENYAKSRTPSKSALRQDLFALLVSGFKQKGYFVEFGACDGLFVSNTFLLEKEFNWEGILSEPARIWHKDLKRNRTCHISTYAVGSESEKKIQFTEYVSPGLSRSGNRSPTAENGRIKKRYLVESITLLDLLGKFNAPGNIDFISIDTEGSELEILQNFDFSKYKISSFAVEHNYGPDQNLVRDLMVKNGYHQVLRDISRYEAWFVLNSELENFSNNFLKNEF
jgi:FkbM family methyltransferase